MRNFSFAFYAVDVGLVEGDRKTYRRAQQLVVVGEIVDPAAEAVDVQFKLTEKTFAQAQFIVIAVRRLYRQTQNFVAQRSNLRRTRDQEIFCRRRLKDAVVGSMKDNVKFSDVVRHAQPRADGVLVDQELVVIPAKSGADRPFPKPNLILHKAGLFQVRLASGEIKR